MGEGPVCLFGWLSVCLDAGTYDAAKVIAVRWANSTPQEIAEMILASDVRANSDANFKRLITTVAQYMKDC